MTTLRSLNLPSLVANRNGASSSSDDMSTALAYAVSASAPAPVGSLPSVSDGPSPTTPTFSDRNHSRFPSASPSHTSSCTSPIFAHNDFHGSASKLPMPKLPEEPAELEEVVYQDRNTYEDSFDSYQFDEDCTDRTTVLLRTGAVYDLDVSAFEEGLRSAPMLHLKNQASTDSGLATLSTRLNSFAQRWTTRKNTLSGNGSGLGIQTPNTSTISGPASSRSSSLTSAHFPGFDQNEVLPHTPAVSVHATSSAPVTPVDEYDQLNTKEPFDRAALSSTPLLPPMMNEVRDTNVSYMQSPLQSPSIAPSRTFSMVSTPAETLQTSALPSPPLSSKPSVASFHRGRSSTLASVADISPLHIQETTDAWSFKLGHANFTILPAPYMPQFIDSETHRRLVSDWDLARQEYFKHRARTAEHYGAGSMTYKLTEQKWQSIDAQWKENSNLVFARLPAETDSWPLAAKPAPLTNMPSITDVRGGSKFPKLGDQDIVGPMERIERSSPIPQTSPPSPSAKLSTFFRSMFARSRSATR